MERLRRRRANRVTPNRNERRKNSKRAKRQFMTDKKIHSLLSNCPASILDTDILQEEHIKIIKDLWLNSASYDYYPVPKKIHNAIRRYAHKHKVQHGESLLGAIIALNSAWNPDFKIGPVPQWEGELSIARIEDCLRELARWRPMVEYNASSPTDLTTALMNSSVHIDTESTINPWD